MISFSKTLTIARPPRLTQKGFGKFDLAHLAVWLDHLTDAQISQLGDLVLDSNDNNQYQCVSKNGKYQSLSNNGKPTLLSVLNASKIAQKKSRKGDAMLQV